MSQTEDGSGALTPVAPSHKKWWGPRIWRILHSLAEVSDRTDCAPAWRIALGATAAVLPCAVCRTHFQEHGRHIPLIIGKSPQEILRHSLWAAHASTGGGLAEADLATEYGCGGNRDEVFRNANALIEEVFTVFRDGNVLDRFTVGHLTDWHHAMRALVALLQSPPPAVTAATPRSRRGPVRRPGLLRPRGAGNR